MKPGTRVRYTDYALRYARDYYLGQHGARREAALRDYERKAAMRGTITEVLTSEYGITGYAVTWDDGTTSRTMAGRLRPALETL